MIEAQQWCDALENKAELAAILGCRAWFNVPPADILPRSRGDIDYGDGRKITGSLAADEVLRGPCGYPFKSHDLWFLTENVRWGGFAPETDLPALVNPAAEAA